MSHAVSCINTKPTRQKKHKATTFRSVNHEIRTCEFTTVAFWLVYMLQGRCTRMLRIVYGVWRTSRLDFFFYWYADHSWNNKNASVWKDTYITSKNVLHRYVWNYDITAELMMLFEDVYDGHLWRRKFRISVFEVCSYFENFYRTIQERSWRVRQSHFRRAVPIMREVCRTKRVSQGTYAPVTADIET